MSASGLNPRFKDIQHYDFLNIMNHSSKDQNEITVLADAVCTLLNDHESFHSNLVCLITQTSIAAVFRHSTISSILTPIRDVAVEFYEVDLFLRAGTSHDNTVANAEHHIRAAQVDYLRACEIIESRFEDLLWDSEELLIAELRGSCGLEILLRLTRRYCSLSSYRLIVMEGIPRRLSMLWDDAREILVCLNHLGEVMSRIQIRFRSPEWRAYYTGRRDVIKLFADTSQYTSCWRFENHFKYGLFMSYTQAELDVDHEYVGPWDPTGFVWSWYQFWR
ncbi:hypothetical protein F5146DRAFT_1064260 [Armillaria mellea]|nr:hypothetical protein F5146DRAFT_1064260 [Armillaria mellea]